MKSNIEHTVLKYLIYLYEDGQIDNVKQEITGINEKYFIDPSSKRIFNNMNKLLKNNKPIDSTTMINTIDRIDVPQFTDIMSQSISFLEGKEYINILKDMYKKRCLEKAINDANRTLNESSIDNPPDKIILNLKNELDKIDNIRTNVVIDMSKVLSDSWNDLEENTNPENLKNLEKWKTGIEGLDDIMGGLRRKQLTLIGAHSGIGKTGLAIQIGLNLTKNGLKGLIVSKEMSAIELVRRMISNIKRINSDKFTKLKFDEEDWKTILDGHNELGNYYFVFETNAQTVSEIEITIKREKPDFVIIDYIQLLSSENKSETREQQVSTISRNLKRVAMTENTSIIMLSQLNENEATGRPTERSIRESRGPYFDSDNVIFLYKPRIEQLQNFLNKRYKDLNVNPKNISYAKRKGWSFLEIILDKNRNGPTGAFMVINKKPYFLFETIGG